MWISHRKEIRKIRISLRWPIHIINPVNKPNSLAVLPTDAAPQFRNLPPPLPQFKFELIKGGRKFTNVYFDCQIK